LEKNKKYLIFALLFVGAFLFLFPYLKRVLKKGDNEGKPAPKKIVPIPSEANKDKAKKLNMDLILKQGSKGEEVKELQKLLNFISAPPVAKLETDGVFGKQTEAVLLKLKGVKAITLNNFTTNINKDKGSSFFPV
jgi:hypothetical protein